MFFMRKGSKRNGLKPKTLQYLGVFFNLSRQRVKQITDGMEDKKHGQRKKDS